jgi:hypothetical protein
MTLSEVKEEQKEIIEPFTALRISIPESEPETKAYESAKCLEKELFGSTPKNTLVIETLQKETTLSKSVSFHDLTNVHEYTPLSNESVCSDEPEYEISPQHR